MTAPSPPAADPTLASIHAMLNPRSIAMVGATERLGYGGRLFNNLVTTGSSARLYPVNPKRETVFGVPCRPTVGDIPEAVDLAVIVLPAEQVLDAFRACIDNGARSALVISAGFAELATPEAIARQQALRTLARESGMRLCGPNCLGIANVADCSWTTPSTRIAPEMRALKGSIGLVSQSGATAYRPLLAAAGDRGIGMRYVVATGNEADLESSDFIRYMLQDPQVRAVIAVVEGFKDGANFARTADLALAAGKPIVMLKIGRSEAGSRGATSHTAAMTGSDVVQDALFTQKGVIRVDDYDELVETAAMFAKVRAPRGNRVGVVSESGGMSSFMADKCGEAGLEVPPLSAATAAKLTAIMGSRGSAANPADLTMFGNGPELAPILGHLLDEEQHDLIAISSVGGMVQAQTVVAAAASSAKPIVFVWSGSLYDPRDRPGLEHLRASDVPLFYQPEKAARAVRRLVDYHRRRRLAGAEAPAAPDEAAADATRRAARGLLDRAAGGALNEHASKALLALYGVAATQEALCASVADARREAARIGYPVALKIVSGEISHKTEAGGVRLGIGDDDALAAAHATMMASVRAAHPGAKLDGVLVQQMVGDGVELIVGVSRDLQFGPVLMLGMGGILVEALGAAAWRVCPVTRVDAQEMIGEVRGLATILAGVRGRPAADVDALLDVLVNISRLAVSAQADIASLDVNPLAVLPKGRGAIALDALVVPARAGAA